MKICSRCGYQNNSDAKNCANCLVDLHWAKVNLGPFTGTLEDTNRIGEEERRRRGLTENAGSTTIESRLGAPQPIRIALRYAAIAFVLSVLSIALLQFFLQFTLAGRWNTSDFWLYGFGISCMIGSIIGAPLAVIVGSIAAISKTNILKRSYRIEFCDICFEVKPVSLWSKVMVSKIAFQVFVLSRFSQLAFRECAQHSVHPIPDRERRGRGGGSRRVFNQFAWLGVGSGKAAFSRPAHQPGNASCQLQ